MHEILRVQCISAMSRHDPLHYKDILSCCTQNGRINRAVRITIYRQISISRWPNVCCV